MQLDELKKYKSEILRITDKYGAENIRIFGSVARGENGQDVDFLVTLRPRTTLLKLAAMERELEGLLDNEVDIVSDRGISKYLADTIFQDAKPL